MKTKQKQNYLATMIILMLVNLLAAPSAQAFADLADISAPDAAMQGMDAIISDLGIDKTEMQNSIQTMNVSRQKQTAPQVSLTFTPSNPQLGDKLTVTAIPLYFMNDASKLYFTWFLKQKDCEKTNNPTSLQKTRCDFNNDGRVDIEDYKIKAMRIVVNNDFNWEAPAMLSSDNKSSYDASYGGDDQKGKNPIAISKIYGREIIIIQLRNK